MWIQRANIQHGQNWEPSGVEYVGLIMQRDGSMHSSEVGNTFNCLDGMANFNQLARL